MFEVGDFPQGTFCWADGQSTDIDKTKAFYTTVLGWTYEDIPVMEGMSYTMFKKDGHNVAGAGPMMQEMQAQGIPSFWTSHVKVDDVDALASKVAGLGGAVMMEPMDVVDSGRMTVVTDPAGAQLGLWQPKNHKGSDLVNTPGAMAWNELMTDDTGAARDFYSGLFGWSIDKMDVPGMEYYMISNAGRPNGGIMPKPEQMAGVPSMWTVYFSVADIDKTVEKVKAAGGNASPVRDSGGTGRFSVVNDPTGMAASFIQLNEPQPWDA